MPESKKSFMAAALEEAIAAGGRGEVPVGAVIVKDNDIIARAGNETLGLNDPSAHAELLAIRRACKSLESQRIGDCDLYVTLEPCTQCAATISFARIRRLYIGTEDPKGGAVVNGVCFFDQKTCFHAPEVYTGIMETECGNLLRSFFQEKRASGLRHL